MLSEHLSFCNSESQSVRASLINVRFFLDLKDILKDEGFVVP